LQRNSATGKPPVGVKLTRLFAKNHATNSRVQLAAGCVLNIFAEQRFPLVDFTDFSG
jgi:hypothetical protein